MIFNVPVFTKTELPYSIIVDDSFFNKILFIYYLKNALQYDDMHVNEACILYKGSFGNLSILLGMLTNFMTCLFSIRGSFWIRF